MINNAKIPGIKTSISILILLIIGIISFGLSALIAVAVVSSISVPLTWIYGLITGQSYDRVCDNSEIIYQLNRIGKWSIAISIGVLVIYGVIKMS